MTPTTLELRNTGKKHHPVAAWLVSGHSIEDRLEEISAWEVDQSALRILPFASLSNDSAVDSLLVLIEGDCRISAIPHCRPYGYVAERVLAPIEGTVFPPVDDAEWKELLPDPHEIYLWHAGRGIVRFSPENLLRLEDFFKTPDQAEIAWDRARTGIRYVDRLFSISSSQPIWNLADLEAAILNEIKGGESLQKLPPVPGESPPSWTERLADGISYAKRMAFSGVRELLKTFPSQLQSELPGIGSGGEIFYLLFIIGTVLLVLSIGNSSQPFQWVLIISLILALALFLWALLAKLKPPSRSQKRPADLADVRRSREAGLGSKVGLLVEGIKTRIGNTFRKLTSGIAGSVNPFRGVDQQKREQEVNRLLHMLETDPEAGLRFAIPFGGEPGRGGGGLPGNNLVEQFFSSFGFASGPADFWNINLDQRQKLTQRYRDLAAREEQAGRYRKAASIYSKLLNDWASAARVLKAGHHYAEAAALYQERLKNIPEAARCYELAGMHKQAIQLYLDSRMWVAAGELCERLNRHSEAEQHYRAAVGHALSIHDIRTAADLLENRLRDIDGTLDVLARSWPNGTGSDNHFELWFDVVARHHKHELALSRIKQETMHLSVGDALKILPHLRRLKNSYPRAEVQHLASEKTLELISSHLPNVDVPHCRQMVSFLTSLVPSDRLLPRDCDRYVERRREEGVPGPREPNPLPGSLTLIRKTRLTGEDLILPVRSCSQGWIALTKADKQSRRTILFGSWSGTVVEYPCELEGPADDCWLLAIDESRKQIWLSSPVKSRHLEWPGTTDVWTLQSPPDSQHEWIGALIPTSGLTLLMSIDDDGMHQFTVLTTGHTKTTRTYAIGTDYVDPGPPGIGYPIGAEAEAILCSLPDGEILSFRRLEDDYLVGELHNQMTGVRNWKRIFSGQHVVLPSSLTSGLQMLLMRSNQVQYFSDPRKGTECDQVHVDWSYPQGAFLSSQLYVIADEHRIAVHSTADRSPRLLHKHQADRPIAVTAIGIGRFSVLRSDGTYEVWQL